MSRMLNREERKSKQLIDALVAAIGTLSDTQKQIHDDLQTLIRLTEVRKEERVDVNQTPNPSTNEADGTQRAALIELQVARPNQEARQPAKPQEGPGPWLNFCVQLGLCVATIGAFAAALWYAKIADQQRISSDLQLGTLLHQVQVAESANELTKNNADAAERQSQTALDATINIAQSDQRPWVESDLTLLEPMRIAQDKGRPVALVEIGVRLYDTGRSPAINARVYSKLIENPTTPQFTEKSAEAYLHRATVNACEVALKENVLVATVFPGKV